MNRPYTIESVSKKTGAAYRTVKRVWDGMPETATFKQMCDAVEAKQEKKAGKSSEASIDPETGLTWFQLKQKEEALEKQRENRIADKVAAKEYVSVEFVENMLALIVNRIEQIPAKAKSEFNLTDAQKNRLIKMHDEVREAAALKLPDIECEPITSPNDSQE